MSSPENVNITSAEMASLWQGYINSTHSNCMLQYFIAKAEDPEILEVLNNALQSMEASKNACRQMLQSENVPVPTGFSNQDVNINAPRLFSDSFSLMYIKNLAKAMVVSNGLMFTASTRKDIREYFKGELAKGTTLFDHVSNVLLDKGLYVRPPFIEPSQKTDFIEDKDYLNGVDFLSDQRYLNSVEISHIFLNINANVLGSALTKAFAQTADLKPIREFMETAEKVSEEVVQSLSEFLTGSELPSPMTSDALVYSSSQSPFSDRLMMYQISVLTGVGLSDYATSLAASMRNDLKRHYMDLLEDTAKLAKRAESLMIEHHWLEQPPQQDRIKP
jgi:spore coat protein CotF